MKDHVMKVINSLIKAGKEKDGFVKMVFLCEAHGMATLANDLDIITKEELEIIYNETIVCIMGVNYD